MIKDKTYLSKYSVCFRKSRNFGIGSLISVDKTENKEVDNISNDTASKAKTLYKSQSQINVNTERKKVFKSDDGLPNTREELMALIKSKPLNFKHNKNKSMSIISDSTKESSIKNPTSRGRNILLNKNKTYTNLSISCHEYNPNYKKNIYPTELFQKKSKLLKISNNTQKMLKSNLRLKGNLVNLYGCKSEFYRDFKVRKKKFDNLSIEVSDSSKEEDSNHHEFVNKILLGSEERKNIDNNNFKLNLNTLKTPDAHHWLNSNKKLPQVFTHNAPYNFRTSNVKKNNETEKLSPNKVKRWSKLLTYNPNHGLSLASNNTLTIPKKQSHKSLIFRKQDTFLRLDANKRLAKFLEREEMIKNIRDTKPKKQDINAIDFHSLSKQIEEQVNPFMKHLKFNKLKKFDYLLKIDNGDIIRDDFELNFMKKLIPGNFLNYDNENSSHIQSAQPRFIKKKFKKASVISMVENSKAEQNLE